MAQGIGPTPAALSPVAGSGASIGAVTAAAETLGVREGMRLGEALATCPELVVVERDPTAAEDAWEKILQALENAGFALEPDGLGQVYFESSGVERLHGGLEPVLWRALDAVGPAWEPRAGAGGRRFVAFAAASSARPGQIVVVPPARTAAFLAPLRLELLPLEPRRARELRELGITTLGELAALPRSAVADRLGADGLSAWQLVRGAKEARISGRRPTTEIVEAIAFPEAVGNEQTLGRAVAVLLERLLARPERERRFVRKIGIAASLETGGSWRRTATLREPTSEPGRLQLALAPKLTELSSPVVELRCELVELSEQRGEQLELVRPAGAELNERLRRSLRQVRASVGAGSVCRVVEVAPWSRIPEARALLVPRDD
jgi:protein ImuB